MPAKVDEIHDALMRDPDFKPIEGRTKEESAWAVAWSQYNQMKKNDIALSLAPVEAHSQKKIEKSDLDNLIDYVMCDGAGQKYFQKQKGLATYTDPVDSRKYSVLEWPDIPNIDYTDDAFWIQEARKKQSK